MKLKNIAKSILMAGFFLGIVVSQAGASFSVQGFELQSKKRVSRTEYVYTFKTSAKNAGENASGVTASLESSSPYTTVVDGELTIRRYPGRALGPEPGYLSASARTAGTPLTNPH